MQSTEAGIPGLADRLNGLFRSVSRPGSTGLWNNESAAWEISRSGPPVSAAYLSQLRTGKRLNPSARHLAALAGIFQVDIDYFFPAAEPAPPAQPDRPSPAACRVMTLLEGVSPAGVAVIESAIASVRDAEALPPIGTQAPPGRPDSPPGLPFDPAAPDTPRRP